MGSWPLHPQAWNLLLSRALQQLTCYIVGHLAWQGPETPGSEQGTHKAPQLTSMARLSFLH